jgi:protein ImuB
MCSVVIACVLIPRFALLAALAERREMLAQAVALAPEPGGPQVVGEVSGAAEAFGIHAGMRLGEALSRCPSLGLVPPDSEQAEEDWAGLLRRLEGIGVAVEPARSGEAFFETEGLRGLWGDTGGVLAKVRRALGRPVRLGAGPTRLCALAAAKRGRARRPPVVVGAGKGRDFLAPLEVGLLRERLDSSWESAAVPDTLERLGVRTLGELAALPDDAIADRFGEPGMRALRLARAEEGQLRPRRRGEILAERLELPEACSGQQLERALGLLIDRLLANPGRRGRSFRSVRLAARLIGGGSWRVEVTLRVASADRERLGLALAPKLDELPGPAEVLSVRAVRMGPAAHAQPSLTHSESERRRELLAEAVSQVRAAAGKEAVMRVLDVDPDSRVPERRMMLTPFPEERRERPRERRR